LVSIEWLNDIREWIDLPMNEDGATWFNRVSNETYGWGQVLPNVLPRHIHNTDYLVVHFLIKESEMVSISSPMKVNVFPFIFYQTEIHCSYKLIIYTLLTDGKHGLSPDKTCKIWVTPYWQRQFTKDKMMQN